jgi:hypothetical protein
MLFRIAAMSLDEIWPPMSIRNASGQKHETAKKQTSSASAQRHVQGSMRAKGPGKHHVTPKPA